ncbi:MAG: hypothetical protein V1895_01935 [Parcubacteria group bacterium]
MSEHPTPPPLPRILQHKPLRQRSSQLFSSAIAIFVTAASALYILIDLAGVNTPRYYPTLYGRLLYVLVGALAITIVHVILRPIFRQVKLIKTAYLTVFATVTTWFAAAIIIVKKWHELNNTPLVNDELYLWIVGAIVFFGGVLLTAAATKRIESLNPTKKSSNTHDQRRR